MNTYKPLGGRRAGLKFCQICRTFHGNYRNLISHVKAFAVSYQPSNLFNSIAGLQPPSKMHLLCSLFFVFPFCVIIPLPHQEDRQIHRKYELKWIVLVSPMST